MKAITNSWALREVYFDENGEPGMHREPEQAQPVAWMHNLIEDNIISHRPADIDRYPERWTSLYRAPKPCPTCESLARTVMMDQVSYDARPQRKPLTDEEIAKIASTPCAVVGSYVHTFARAIEAAHGIKENT